MNDHFSPFLINSLVCFILFSVVFATVQSFFLRICKNIVLLKAAQANCSGYAVLLLPNPGAILCQTVDSHLSYVRHWQVFQGFQPTQ